MPYGFEQGDGAKISGDVVTKDVRAWYVRLGQAFETATVFTGIGSGSVVNLTARNPTGSGKKAILQAAKFSTSGQATVRIYNGSNVTEGTGTVLDVENRKTDAGDTTDNETLLVYSQPTVTTNDPNPADAFVLGSAGGQARGAAGESGGTLLPPGTNRHFQVTSGSASNTIAFTLIWHELPEASQ